MKTKVTIEEVKKEDEWFPMSEMKPGQICIVQRGNNYKKIVMRTLSEEKFEVMDLFVFDVDSCWTKILSTLVKEAPKGTKVTFEVV